MSAPNTEELKKLALTFKKTSLPDSEVELAGEVPFPLVAPFEAPALAHLAEHLSLPGFRPGHVPAEMARKQLGEVAILEEAVEQFMQGFYPALVAAHELDAIGRPQIAITKLAPGNPVGLVARTAVYPQVALPKDWRSLGQRVPEETTEEQPEDSEEEKARKVLLAREKRRGALIDALLADTQVAVPRIFVESELEKILAQLKDDLARFGAQAGSPLSFEAYLAQVGKTQEQVREEFRESARKRAVLQLALNKVAEEAGIEPDQAAVAKEVAHAKEHFPDAQEDLLRVHVETVLRNDAALRLLEGV